MGTRITVSEEGTHEKHDESITVESSRDFLLGDFASGYPLCERCVSGKYTKFLPIFRVAGHYLAGVFAFHTPAAETTGISNLAFNIAKTHWDGRTQLCVPAQFHLQFFSAVSRIGFITL